MTDAKPRTGLSSQVRKDLIQRFLHPHAQTSPVSFPISSGKKPGALDRIPDHVCQFEQFEGYQKFLVSKIASQKIGVQNPFFRTHDALAGATTLVEGKSFLNFSSYNYLGLAGHPRVNQAAKAAIDRYGTSASASRLVAGERPIQRELECALSECYGTEDCVVFVSGHATNVSTIGTLFGPKDLIIHDALIHNSVLEGIKLSGAARRSFAHNTPEALEAVLAELRPQFERVLIVIEGLYSMDGDIPDLPHFIDIKRRYKALLMVDDAHALGVLGDTGMGVREHYHLQGSDVDIWMGTLSKTLAGCGGYICGNHALVENLKYNSGGFVYSVGISPVLAAASLEALRILKEETERVRKLREHTLEFLGRAKQLGMDAGYAQGYAIIPIIVKSSLKAAKISNQMFDQGINVQPIIYPAVEERNARLRFFISCEHTSSQIHTALEALNSLL